MKFSCGSCATSYTVPDDKVRGRRIRIACKKCGESIVFEGPKSIPPPEPVPMRSVQQTQLGIPLTDKSGAAPKPGGAPPKPPVPSRSLTPKKPDAETWTVAVTRKDPRKMTVREIVEAFSGKVITEQTLVWKKGMTGWKALFDVPELSGKLRDERHDPAADDLARAPTPEPKVSTEFDDENEATRVLGASDVSAPSARDPKVPATAAGSKRTADSGPETSAAPAPAATPGFDDDETTAVIDSDRAHALLSNGAAGPKPRDAPATLPPPPGGAETMDRPGIATAKKLIAETADDEADITRDATSTAAQELLRGSPGAPRMAKDPAPSEPSVVVSEDEKKFPEPASSKKDKAKPSSGPQRAVHPVQLAIQNEPTRIVMVKTKGGGRSLLVGFLIVAFASAAGGFIASRLMAPDTPADAPSGER